MIKKIQVIIILLILGGILWNPLSAQIPKENAWDILADVSYTAKYLEEFGEKFLVPEFGQKPRQHEGKAFTITGYMIPIDPENDIFILSKNPFASCFFCGSAGPETIVELIFKKKSKVRKKTYQIDDIRTFRGVLRLNAEDVEHTNFILEKAEEVM
ncbi:MAG: hypothetical protein AAF694_20890 [Bacteroidota bacterium]